MKKLYTIGGLFSCTRIISSNSEKEAIEAFRDIVNSGDCEEEEIEINNLMDDNINNRNLYENCGEKVYEGEIS